MTQQYEISLPSYSRGFHIIDKHIQDAIREWPETGICHLFIKHTSAALAINEGADPDVRKDMRAIFDRLVPENQPYYTHTDEGQDDMPSHAKAVMAGSSLSIPISRGRLNIGTWQSIYLCEFRNQGGSRRLVITILS